MKTIFAIVSLIICIILFLSCTKESSGPIIEKFNTGLNWEVEAGPDAIITVQYNNARDTIWIDKVSVKNDKPHNSLRIEFMPGNYRIKLTENGTTEYSEIGHVE